MDADRGTPAAPARIWYQSFVDPVEQGAYIRRLQERLDQLAAPGVRYEVHGISPPDRHLSALTELRCAVRTVRHALQAATQGYDAFVIGHFQEPGLLECRAAVDIPVIGLGEATMLHACTLGRSFGLVTIHPVFIPWHRDQIVRLGLQQRAAGVRAMDTQVASYVRAFDDPGARDQIKSAFVLQAKELVDAGAEVLIPAGGLPMLLLADERGFEVDGALVLDGIAVIATMAEAALRLHRQTGAACSRRGSYARAPREAIDEFLADGGKSGTRSR